MKTKLNIVFALFFALGAVAQQVERNNVVLEVAISTSNSPSSFAEEAINAMVENGSNVAVIAYHKDDEYENQNSLARIAYYEPEAYPTVYFDGVLSYMGSNNNLYPNYLDLYSQRIDIPSDYSIEVIGVFDEFLSCDIIINVERVGSGSITNPRVHAVLTESNIPVNWGGLDEANYVERLMLPNNTGTSLDFSNSTSVSTYLSFNLDSTWVSDNCALVVFLQNSASKEILQGVVYDLADFEVMNTTDAGIVDVKVPKMICGDSFIPKVKIANYGFDILTSLEINYQLNGSLVYTYNWSGSLIFFEKEIIELDEIPFTLLSDNDFSVTCSNPNGNIDQNTSNDNFNVSFQEAMEVEPTVGLFLKLDNDPEETSWEILDSQDNVLFSGGNYTVPGAMIIENFELAATGCYKFVIYDEGANGLTNSGIYKLFYGSNQSIIYQNSSFTFEEEIQFNLDVLNIEEDFFTDEFTVFPNPITAAAKLNFGLSRACTASYCVTDMLGQQIISVDLGRISTGDKNYKLNFEGQEPGIYFITININGVKTYKKILLSK